MTPLCAGSMVQSLSFRSQDRRSDSRIQSRGCTLLKSFMLWRNAHTVFPGFQRWSNIDRFVISMIIYIYQNYSYSKMASFRKLSVCRNSISRQSKDAVITITPYIWKKPMFQNNSFVFSCWIHMNKILDEAWFSQPVKVIRTQWKYYYLGERFWTK